jgi:large subunit ribosomal protein L29
MAGSELAAMEPSELEHHLAESRRELFNLRFQLATGQLDNTARLGHVRKEVARILTYLRQHELGMAPDVGFEPAEETKTGPSRGSGGDEVDDTIDDEEEI